MKKIITLLTSLLFVNSIYSQIAPTTGKKILEVKESYDGEYFEKVKQGDLPSTTIEAMKKKFPKTFIKYGFTDITIKEVGKVDFPSTSTSANNFKFQANLIDNKTGNLYKVRIGMMSWAPKYIIKERIKEVKKEKTVAKDYCNEIKVIKDKFEDKTTYYSPSVGKISLGKSTGEKEDGSIYMFLVANSSQFSTSEKGLIILFDDGTKISKPNESIRVKMGKGKYFDYKATIKLNDEEIKLFKEKIVTDFRLYIYDEEVKNGKDLQEYINCMIK
ncbi:hypothetical protein [Aquimarina agarivorans]|uniref:hypothetical protein n=1 Tax=Aquimarina agarivorans TaxID=980584 RepID=UPI000248F918|nr:hypothetical protein [Aquimarina agarivorans]